MLDQISAISHLVTLLQGRTTTNDPDFGPDGELFQAIQDIRSISNPKSIASESRKSIYEYPFLISSNITSLDTIAGIIKGCEIEYVNMIILMAGIDPTVNTKTGIEIRKKLSAYHTKPSDYSTYEDVGINTLTLENAWKKANGLAFEDTIPNNFSVKYESNMIVFEAAPKDDEDKNDEGKVFPMKSINDKYSNMFNMTIINIQLRLNDDEKTNIKIPIGVKGIGHHLPYNELIYIMNRYISHQSQGFINRYIRWTSGELKGLHNLLLRYDEIKSDIEYEKKVGTSNSWMKVLRSRANNHKVNVLTNSIRKANGDSSRAPDILPDCTFVISMGDVDKIEEETGINLFTNPAAASKFLNAAMGLGLIIVDDIHAIAHILFSSYTRYTSTPIKAFASKIKSEGDATEIMLDFMKRV
jgi:hypothetical protein